MKNVILSSLLLIVLFMIGIIAAPIILFTYILRKITYLLIEAAAMLVIEITYLCGGDVDKLQVRIKEILNEE